MKALKSILTTILLGANALLSVQKSIAAEMPRPYVQTTLTSALVSPAGLTVAENARQDWISINPIKNLELGIWQNQFLGEKRIAEQDYCLTYSTPLYENLTGSIGIQYWNYLNKRFGDHDSAIDFNLKHKGYFDTSLKFRQLNHTSQTEAGSTLCAPVSKTIPLTNGKVKLTLTPYLSTALNYDYLGNNGPAHLTPGVKLGVSYKNFNASAFFNTQRGISKDIPTQNSGGVSVGVNF